MLKLPEDPSTARDENSWETQELFNTKFHIVCSAQYTKMMQGTLVAQFSTWHLNKL